MVLKIVNALFVVSVLAVIFSNNSEAQDVFHQKYFSEENDLLNRPVSEIIEDSDGRIWFQSKEKISWFDGEHKKRLIVKSQNSIPNRAKVIDRSLGGGILIATKKTIEKFDKNFYAFHTVFSSEKNGVIQDGFLDAVQVLPNEYFFVNRSYQLYRVTDNEITLFSVAVKPRALFVVDSAHLLLQKQEGGFALFNVSRQEIVYQAKGNGVPVISDKIYVFDNDEILEYGINGLVQSFSVNHKIQCIASDTSGALYFASGNKIYRNQSSADPIFSISKNINSFIVSKNGNFWVTDCDGGIHFVYKNAFNKAIEIVRTVSSHEKLFFAENRYYSYNLLSQKVTDLVGDMQISVPGSPLNYKGYNNSIVVKSKNDLFVVDSSRTVHRFQIGDSLHAIYAFYFNKSLYFFDKNFTMYAQGRNGEIVQLAALGNLYIEAILGAEFDGSQIILATNEGVIYIDFKAGVSTVKRSSKIKSSIGAIKKIKSVVYVCADDKIYRIGESGEELIFTSKGKKIVDFSIDDSRLAVLTVQDLLLTLLGDSAVSVYNFYDGFTSFYHNIESKIWLRGTDLFLSKNNNLFLIKTDRLTNNPLDINVLISSLKIADSYIDGTKLAKDKKTLLLNYRESDLTIHFTSNYYTYPSKLMYSYRMLGLSDEWIFAEGTNKSVSYFNLKGGTYTFQVRAYTDTEEFPSEITSLAIRIDRPFWESKWFYLGVLIVCITFVVFVYNARVTKIERMRGLLEKQVEYRTKNLQEKTDELNNQKVKMQEQRDIANKLKAELAVDKLELEELRDKLTRVIDARNSDNLFLSKTLDKAQKDLKRLEKDYELIAGNTHEIIISMTLPDESFEFISPSAYDVTGYFPYEFQEKSTLLKSIVHKDDVKSFLEARNQMFLGNVPENIHYRIVTKQGDIKWIRQRNFLEENQDGEPSKLKLVLTDITIEKLYEQRDFSVKKRTQVAQLLKENIGDTDDHKASHVIGEIADLLLESKIVFDEKELYADDPSINNDIPLQIIDDIIDLARIEANQLILTKSNCYINTILNELYSSFEKIKIKIGKQNVELKLNIASDKENFSIYTDTYRVRQVLLNLLGNAFRYTSKGIIEFGYEIEASSEDVDEELQNILFYVKDTGVGMEPFQINQIFSDTPTKFEKGDNTFISEVGLIISKLITDLLGGRMWVDSVKNVGTAFYFTLPLKKHKGLKQDAKAEKEDISQNWKGKTILVAEDEENNFRFIKAALKKTGVELIHAQDGIEALRIFKEKNKELSVVLMDIQMPNMNGYDAARAFIQINSDVPIIAQTAFAMSGGKIKCFEAGCAGYIAKPYKAKDLIEAIDKHLS